MKYQNRIKIEKLNRQLIAKYMHDKDNAEYLRYLIDTIYDDITMVCEKCNNGLLHESRQGDYRACDVCNRVFRYRA